MHIETDRLIIRDFTKSDLIDLHEIFSDDEVMRNCEEAYDFGKTQEFLAEILKRNFAFAVVEKSSDKVIGYELFKQLPGEDDGIYEIGWIYNSSYWRRGYAYEASKALIDYGFNKLRLHKICAEAIDYIKSVSLMKKLGMKEEGIFRKHTYDLDGKWTDLYWYAILEEDFNEK